MLDLKYVRENQEAVARGDEEPPRFVGRGALLPAGRGAS